MEATNGSSAIPVGRPLLYAESFQDLGVDPGLGAIDTTISAAGARSLKARLRGDASNADSAPAFRALIRSLTGDGHARDRAREALRATYENERILDGGRSVWTGALESPKTLVAGGVLVPPFFVATLALAPFHPTAIAWLVGVALLGTVVRARLWTTIDTARRSLRAAGELVAISQSLTALPAVASVPEIAQALRTDDARHVAGVNRTFKWFQAADENPRRILVEYTSLLLWWDVPMLIYGLMRVRQADSALERLSHAVGDCDAAAAIGDWRAHASDWSSWSTDGDLLRMRGGRHPAIASADPFDVELRAGAVTLVTGRHGAGKSTLLRALGFNAAMAISTDTACARELTAPNLRIRTTFTHDDQPTGTESLFESELTRLADIISDALGSDRLLILLDEPLRGTNPEERRAITIAALEHLAGRGHYVAATTNDPFIVQALRASVDTFAVVRETRADGSVVRSVSRGAQVERKAIALLSARGAPVSVIERATALADQQLARDDR